MPLSDSTQRARSRPHTGHIISFAGVTESLTTLGPLARRVEDLDLVLRSIAGPDSYDPAIAPEPLNLTGWPVAVVRIGKGAGDLPIGVQIAKPWREDVALAVAMHLESAFGGFAPPAL